MNELKELRYRVMLALYFPILLYAFSTFDLDDNAFVVSEIEPVIVGEQNVVLGQPFSAGVFLAMSKGQGQELQATGDLVALGDSVFKMETGALLAEHESVKEIDYAGRFRFRQVDGELSEIPVSGRFTVRRPEIVTTSEATQVLYRECLNTVRFDVPGLENRALRLDVGGRFTNGRTASLSPSGEQTTVRVFLADSLNGDVFLGRKSFATIEPPRPEIRILNAGRAVQNGDNVPRQRAVLSFDVQADAEFARRFPQDARYRIARATVFLRKGLAASQEIGTIELEAGNTLMLTRVLRDAQPGDRLLIRIEGVYRINHAGRAVPVLLSETSRTFGFVLS